MNNQEKMLHHLAEAERFHLLVEEIEKVIGREVTKRYGHRIGNGNSPQERENLRQFYMKRISNENVWLQRATGNRAFHMAMAQMYGTAALVDRWPAHWDVGID